MDLILKNKHNQPTFFIHDYETFGKHPALDRPAQFAGVRTDLDFNIIDEPEVFYCKPTDDYLPQPEAVMITGITPQIAMANGMNEAEFAKRIHNAFSVPNTCIMGYNNIRFDDEVTRNIFYRNFYDPYAYSWQQGNSRWDLLDALRACFALRPEGINWPENDDGLPSLRLEHLTKANGVAHENAHDAMSDVLATINMAKLLKQAQPRMFDYFYQLRNKNKVNQLIDIVDMTPLVHVSGMFGAVRSYVSLVAPLAWHPENKNAVIMCDLSADMSPLLTLNADELRERLYTPKAELGDELPVPVKLVHINKCPILAPEKTLRTVDAERTGIDRDLCMRNLELLRKNPDVRNKLIELFSVAQQFEENNDVDSQIYNGFFSPSDRSTMDIIRETPPQNLPALDLSFEDKRMKELFFRYKARNFPATLSYDEQQRWLQHRRDYFTESRLTDYLQQIQLLMEVHHEDEKRCQQLKALVNYAAELAS
ncbi:exodeoxyribonuclease I [Providencia sp. PROV188]|jgi:exodeoxyribonuclease-1|uniref:exodeoxyribonuclease I n=1 Tax=Providencia TaxID=586 RepID=UPI0003E20E85|nr:MULTISPECIES: exodeoxyribonuclease I [Providencia]ETS99940.1 exodeoxyribonuclease I [Providencia alcalifaciens PAL-3]EUD00924.1 exodeoxyribonuclease I [Providencia alcalifaciens PAL-1]MBG5882472.1 exodeoxyribonuclease I [Providencia alcalifaciens]MDR2243692.1 exodeoxyribonuclease I [Providencia alcalifaciens]MTB45294.1 exodeoxyribonuclease I [Providencia sp. wls1950]